MILAHQLASRLDLFSNYLTVSHSQTVSGLVGHNMILAVCGKMQPCLKVGNWQWAVGILPEPGPMILVHWLASRPGHQDWIRAFFGRTELNQMQEVGSGIYDPTLSLIHI